MKNIKVLSVVIIVLCSVHSLRAQTEKGKLFLGASTNLSIVKNNMKWETDEDDGDLGKTTSIELKPMFGHFVSQNLVVGVELPISYNKSIDEDDMKSQTTIIAMEPFVRYYMGSAKIKPYVHAGVGIGRRAEKYDQEGYYSYNGVYKSGSSVDSTYAIFLYEVGGGAALFFNKYISLDVSLGYVHTSYKENEGNGNNYRNIVSGLGFQAGFVFTL